MSRLPAPSIRWSVRLPPVLRALRLALAATLLAGCAHGGGTLGYYFDSLNGHLQLMHAAQPLSEWLARPDTSPALRERLLRAQRARAFAVRVLHLPDNASYHRYADLQRSSAVWNVVAAPPYSLRLHTWCFPVLGCVGYRGYFKEADAKAQAQSLARQGLEVEVYGVPAYSTLGAFNWAGGDPLLNTFLAWPEGEFVRLLFHELAHQVVYADGDTLFNESFATAVGNLGLAAWLAHEATPEVRTQFAQGEAQRTAFRDLTRATRTELAALYAGHQDQSDPNPALEARKQAAMEQFRERYAMLSAHWPAAQRARYDRWVAQANNASFGAQAAYDELVPAFEALFAQCGQDWPRFYDAVRVLAREDAGIRETRLRALLAPATPAAKDLPRA